MILNFIRRLFLFLFHVKKKYLFRGSIVICKKGSSFHVGKHVSISKCRIYLHSGTELKIGDHTCINNTHINLLTARKNKTQLEIGDHACIKNTRINLQTTGLHDLSFIGSYSQIFDANINVNGRVIMGEGNIIEKGYYYRPVYIIINGNLIIGERNRLRCIIWSRYNSTLEIGSYNNINEESELRCDERITIGDFNQISYHCSIWDTNTHNIYKATERRDLTISKYPIYGYEFEKPKTKPIVIGSDCWIGKNATILKGTAIGNKCVIGYGVILSNVQIGDNHTIVLSKNLRIFENKI